MNHDLLQAIRTALRPRRHVLMVIAVLFVGGLVGGLVFVDQRGAEPGVLSAGNLGLLLGYTLALALFWFAGYRVARLLPEGDTVSLFIQDLIKPGLTLITLALGYDVLSIALEPFLSSGGRTVYDYMFTGGIVGSCFWFVVALARIAPRGRRSRFENSGATAVGVTALWRGSQPGSGQGGGPASQNLQPFPKPSVSASALEHHV